MPVLTAVVCLLGILCLLNLLLILGVLRRLREHGELLRNGAFIGDPGIGLEAGDRPSPFSATTTSGTQVSDTSELLLVAFFSTTCPMCTERVEPFARYIRSHEIAPERALAVIVQDSTAEAPFRPELEDVATVCVEPTGGQLSTAFRVAGFPAFWLLGADGAVAVATFDPAMLPSPDRI
jgi:hypothetical protein